MTGLTIAVGLGALFVGSAIFALAHTTEKIAQAIALKLSYDIEKGKGN